MKSFYQRARYATISVCFCLFVCFLDSADLAAQTIDQDYEALQLRAVQENWTFNVTRTPALSYPLPTLLIDAESILTDQQAKEARVVPEYEEVAPLAGPSVLPPSWNWCQWGVCSPVKNQGGCGGCFAFAAFGIFESAILLNDANEVDLSEQWAISCTGAGNCVNGGFPGTVLDYSDCQSTADLDLCGDHGAVMESEFPFVAADVACTGCPYNHPYCVDSWSLVDRYNVTPSDDDIKRAIIDHGPVSVSMATDGSFQAYGGGVFNACTATVNNHYVILVGWDDTQGTNGVWLLRNSWGTAWGEDLNGISWDVNGDGIQDNAGGYMRIEYGCVNVGDLALFLDYADTNAAVWTDFMYSGTSNGSFWAPFGALQEAVTQVESNGRIVIKSGTSSESITISKPVTIGAVNGHVIIGRN